MSRKIWYCKSEPQQLLAKSCLGKRRQSVIGWSLLKRRWLQRRKKKLGEGGPKFLKKTPKRKGKSSLSVFTTECSLYGLLQFPKVIVAWTRADILMPEKARPAANSITRIGSSRKGTMNPGKWSNCFTESQGPGVFQWSVSMVCTQKPMPTCHASFVMNLAESGFSPRLALFSRGETMNSRKWRNYSTWY